MSQVVKSLKKNGSKRKLTDELDARSLGLKRRISVVNEPSSLTFLLHHNLLKCWTKRDLDIGKKNKVFASAWLNSNNVIYGTKCNQLCVLDIATKREYSIPLLRGQVSHNKLAYSSSNETLSGSASTVNNDLCSSGIHAISPNPSGTMLASGGQSVWEVGLYRLPELTPYALLTEAHQDWVFDLCWIDDEFLVSCSRDTSLALWRANPDDRSMENHHRDGYGLDVPVCKVKAVHSDDRFRAVDYSKEYNVLAVLTMSSRLYLYDPVRLVDKMTLHSRLSLNSDIRETVALRRCPTRPEILSICSQKVVVCLDVRCPSSRTGGFKVYSLHGDCGIRSVNFQGDLLSYGTSQGGILFYDIRARQHLQLPGSGELNVGMGWLDSFPSIPQDNLGLPAVYTHEYDPTGTRLFAAGGPIAAAYHGNVACLWE